MSPRLYSVGILTVSDTAAADPLSDTSGPLLRRQLEAHPSDAFRVVTSSIVPDEPTQVTETVKKWIDETGVRLVITTGGTGLGTRDGTPEALSPLIDKPTSGLTHALTSYSLLKTPLAALSRSISGIRLIGSSTQEAETSKAGRKGALIIALPGSNKAVKECLEVLLGTQEQDGVLLHALELCTGSDDSSRKTHQRLQASSSEGHDHLRGTETDTGASRHYHRHQHGKQHDHQGHSHHHHHGHSPGGIHSHSAPTPRTASYLTHSAHGPSTLRARQSPYPILSLAKALSLIDRKTPAAKQIIEVPVNEQLVGHVLAQDVVASTSLPPGNTTNVDGYAVLAGQTPPGKYKVVTASQLSSRGRKLAVDEVCRVNTGQGLPEGTDGVVMVEDTELVSTASDSFGREDEKEINVLAQIDSMENVRKAGSDVKASQVVLRQGTTISALGGEIGTLAFLGVQSVKVFRKPRVAILSTGDELQDLAMTASDGKDRKEAWGFEVFDANRPGLRAAIEGMDLQVLDLGIYGDNPEKLVQVLKQGVAEADIILTTGGTSMGESDLLKPIIERELQGVIHFGRVAMKPGKPTTFATIDRPETDSPALFFALPGNPASALVCFYVFVLPSLRKLIGYKPREFLSTSNEDDPDKANPYSLPRIKVRIESEMKLDPRPEFHRVVLAVDGKGELVAKSTGSQRSSGMHSMATANALVCVPALTKDAATKTLQPGEYVDAMLLGGL